MPQPQQQPHYEMPPPYSESTAPPSSSLGVQPQFNPYENSKQSAHYTPGSNYF